MFKKCISVLDKVWLPELRDSSQTLSRPWDRKTQVGIVTDPDRCCRLHPPCMPWSSWRTAGTGWGGGTILQQALALNSSNSNWASLCLFFLLWRVWVDQQRFFPPSGWTRWHSYSWTWPYRRPFPQDSNGCDPHSTRPTRTAVVGTLWLPKF